MMALGTFPEEPKWRRLFVKDAESQLWKLQFEAPDGKRYDCNQSEDVIRRKSTESSESEGDCESCISSISSCATTTFAPLQIIFCSRRPNIIDFKKRTRKGKKCLRLPPAPIIQIQKMAKSPVLRIALVDVFRDTPLCKIPCCLCLKTFAIPDFLTIDFSTDRLKIECSRCDWGTVRVYSSKGMHS
uniref:Uncharacterized protein n=1 Tax=Lepeophtheirus salmonis TaxID=72036 RepID=A0A0K2TTP4_LEPSM|nr:uncharacterized protein LOC121131811 [Lepeophtheirus salmonis]